MTESQSYKPLAGKFAVVTGGTQGLGETIARLFAERGAAGLVICGRNRERGKQVAKSLTGAGCPTSFVEADLGRVEDCRRVIAEADRRFGNLHALVNVAALTDRGTILDTSPELFDRMFAVNVRAPFFLMQDAVKTCAAPAPKAPSSISLACRGTAASLSSRPTAPRRGRSPR